MARRSTWMVSAAAALCAALAPAATASPGPPGIGAPAHIGHGVHEVVKRVDTMLGRPARVLPRVEFGPQRIVPGTPTLVSEAWIEPSRVVFATHLFDGLAAMVAGRCTRPAFVALYTSVHEAVHPQPVVAGGPEWIEEGVTDAVTMDLFPRVWAERCGGLEAGLVFIQNYWPRYPGRVRQARVWSARAATGKASRWDGSAARVERRRVLGMSGPQRAAWWESVRSQTG